MATRSKASKFGSGTLRLWACLACATLVMSLAPSLASSADPNLSIEEVTRQVNALNDQASNANENYLSAQINVTNAQQRLSAVQSRINREQASLNRVQKSIGSLASMAYRSGGLDSSLELLLADDPKTFLNKTAALDQLSRGQGTALRRAEAASQRLAQDRLALGQELGTLKSAQASAASSLSSVNSKARQAQALLDRLTAADRARYLAALAARRASSARASREALRTAGSSSDGGGGFSGGGVGSGRAAIAVAYAKAQVGDSYVWGAAGPNSFDCSGLMLAAWRAAGVSLPHQSGAQYGSTSRVSRSELRPGDLLFFYSPISHVGMYIGGGLMVHAANPSSGVEVSSLSGYWSSVYVGAGRV